MGDFKYVSHCFRPLVSVGDVGNNGNQVDYMFQGNDVLSVITMGHWLGILTALFESFVATKAQIF